MTAPAVARTVRATNGASSISISRISWITAVVASTNPALGIRVVRFTPTGSACSITFGTGMPQAEPGSYRNRYLVVSDIARAYDALVERGIAVSDIYHWTQEGSTPGVDPNRADFGPYAEFADPDGNTWLVQEVPSRASTEV